MHAVLFTRDAEADRAFFKDALYLLCHDLEATAKELEGKGVTLERPFDEPAWGRVTQITLPSGGQLGLYQPKHPLAHGTS